MVSILKLNIHHLPCDPRTPLLGIHVREIKIYDHKKDLIEGKHIHKMEHHSAIKREKTTQACNNVDKYF